MDDLVDVILGEHREGGEGAGAGWLVDVGGELAGERGRRRARA